MNHNGEKDLPSVSILVPTLNADAVLSGCLKSVVIQNYPKEKLEIIVADGGSTDNTLDIIAKFKIQNVQCKIKILSNPLKTGEAGKAVALRHAGGELVVLIDSDNILPNKDWLRRMIEPFSDTEIIGSEPWEFTYRKEDEFIDRYCALIGMNDPLCYFFGNYDKRNTLTGKWTELPVECEDRGNWMKLTLRPDTLPTIGANGTILKRGIFLSHLEGVNIGDYLFDIDIIASLAAKKPVKFAKVKTGIIHLYCGRDLGKFIRKQKRRVRDYLFYQKLGVRKYPWQKQNKLGLLKFALSCVTIVPLFYQSVRGCLKKPDSAWFFHPLACWITFLVYGWEGTVGRFKIQELNRDNWRQ